MPDLAIPDHLRRELAKPFGPVVQTPALRDAVGTRPCIAVGDVVALTLKRLGVRPRLIVCDFRTQRGQEDPQYRAELDGWADHQVTVTNPAGSVTQEAWLAVAAAIARPEGMSCIVVTGEEDLLGIPAFAEAPLDWVVVYGMPGQGAVVAVVDQDIKDHVRALLADMEPH